MALDAWLRVVVMPCAQQHGNRRMQQTREQIRLDRLELVANLDGAAAVVQSLGMPPQSDVRASGRVRVRY